MSGRLTVAIGLLASAVVWSVAPVQAAPGTGGGVGSGGSVGEIITAGVTYRGEGSGTGGGGGSACSWERVDGTLRAGENGETTFPIVKNGVTYLLWLKQCTDGSSDWYLVPETTPQDLLPGLLEQMRERRLPRPVPVFQMLDPVHGWAYVTVPVDFRTDPGSWRTVSVSASVGPVWATVTAVPVALRFDPGDPAAPGEVECAGSDPVAAYVAEVPGGCSYTYRNASSTSVYDGYHFMTTSSIDWDIFWTSSTGAGGPLDSYSTSASAPLAVAEVKGLVMCTGPRGEQGGC